MTYRPLLTFPGFTPAGAALLALAGIALSGCSRDDSATKAIDRAGMQIQALAPAGANPPSADFKKKVYQGITSELTKVNGTKAQNAAAALLLAQAQAGLAEGPASQALELERGCLNDIVSINALFGQYLALNATADAAAAYDPSKEVGDLDGQTKAREEERVEQQRQKAAVDQRVADILAQAKQKSDSAKAKQQEAGSLRSQVPNQSAVQGEQTLKQAQEIGRQGDALEVAAADLEAQAAQISPQSAEIQLQIDRLSNQKDLLAQARANVLKRAENAKAQATQARADAAKVAEEIGKRVDTLAARRADVMKALDEAASEYKSSAGSAKKAMSDSRGQAQLANGSAEQSLGDIEWARAQGLSAYASMLDTLAGAKPALPKGSQYKSMADEARAAAKTALEAATDAYTEANDAYQKAGGSDKERLDRINSKLAAAVKATSGGAKDIRNPDAPKDGEKPAETPASPSAAAPDANSPQAVVQALFDLDKTKAYDTAADLFLTSNDQERQAVRSMMSLGSKGEKLKAAMQAKFGAEGEQAMTAMASQQAGGADISKLKDLKASDLKFNIQGDTAEAALPTGKSIKLKQQDGKWKIDVSTLGVSAEQLAAAQASFPAIANAMDDLAAEIQAGKYPNAQAASAAFMTKMMGAAMQGMPKNGGGKK